MAKIRQFNILHYNKVKKMLSDIFPEESLSLFYTVLGLPFDIVQPFMPLLLKKSPESYITLNDENVAKAFITLEAAYKNRRKWYIKSLFLDKNSYTEGKQLIDFTVARYGALGADTFCVLVDENDDTSAGLFSKMCGFRLCSREVLWKVPDFNTIDTPYKNDCCQKFSNSDRNKVADFYNECILPHFRFSLEKEPNEFFQKINFGFLNSILFKLYIKDNNNIIMAYVELQCSSVHDWIIDLIVAKSFEDEYLPILKALINILKNRSKDSNIFVLNKNYMSCAKTCEDILIAVGCEKIQSKMLFVKDFYKPVKNSENIVNPALIFKEISEKPAFFSNNSLQKSD